MGKKSKAKARKAAKEKSRAIAICQGLSDRLYQVERWRVGSCAHGVNTNALVAGSVCRSFVDRFLDVLASSDSSLKIGEAFVNALEKTYENEKYREQVWDDDIGKI